METIFLVLLATVLLIGMAVAHTAVDTKVPGSRKLIDSELALDNAYPQATGGYPINAETFGLTTMDWFLPVCASTGFVPVLDRANSKLRMFKQTGADGALVEVANGVDLSATKVYLLVSGI